MALTNTFYTDDDALATELRMLRLLAAHLLAASGRRVALCRDESDPFAWQDGLTLHLAGITRGHHRVLSHDLMGTGFGIDVEHWSDESGDAASAPTLVAPSSAVLHRPGSLVSLTHAMFCDERSPWPQAATELLGLTGSDLGAVRELTPERRSLRWGPVDVSVSRMDALCAQSRGEDIGFEPTLCISFDAAWADCDEAETLMLRFMARYLRMGRAQHVGLYRNWESPFVLWSGAEIRVFGATRASHAVLCEELGEASPFVVRVERWNDNPGAAILNGQWIDRVERE
jgi:hypothetical protein